MNPKIALFFFAAIVGIFAENVLPVPERFPPGVHPLLCPGYPICDNELLHTARVVYIPPVNEYPPGVDPEKCPNYPFCGTPLNAVVLKSVGPLPVDGKTVFTLPELLRGVYYVKAA